MRTNAFLIPLLVLVIMSAFPLACTDKMHENIQERSNLNLGEGVLARDKSLEVAVLQNIQNHLGLRWYAQTYDINIEVSHQVATVYMKVRTEEERDEAIRLALATDGIQEIIDDIVIDRTIEPPPFEW